MKIKWLGDYPRVRVRHTDGKNYYFNKDEYEDVPSELAEELLKDKNYISEEKKTSRKKKEEPIITNFSDESTLMEDE